MNQLATVLSDVAAHLSQQSRRWAITGGLAISARTTPRFTRDLDLLVVVDSDEEADAVVASLVEARYAVIDAVKHEADGRTAAVRLYPPGSGTAGIIVDLLFASSGIEAEVVRDSEPIELLPGLLVRLPRVGHIIALKTLCRDDRLRPQDLSDLAALLEHADRAELEQAHQALTLITERGFHRDRDLNKDLDSLLELLVGD